MKVRRELLAVIHAFTHWQGHMEVVWMNYTAVTDHSPYMFFHEASVGNSDASARQSLCTCQPVCQAGWLVQKHCLRFDVI